MKEEEPHDTPKSSEQPVESERASAGDDKKEPVIHYGRATLDGHGLLSTRGIVLRAGAIELGIVTGVLGLILAFISTIWCAPENGFDGWWTRLSAGFALGSLPVAVLSHLLSLRVEIAFSADKLCNPLTWRFRKRIFRL